MCVERKSLLDQILIDVQVKTKSFVVKETLVALQILDDDNKTKKAPKRSLFIMNVYITI
jgi:hypothetical protein